MPKRIIIDDQLDAHFSTFSCDRRRRLLSLDQPKRIVLGVLNQELKRLAAKCIGFVIMPNHVHAIVWFPVINCLSTFMHEWKRASIRFIRDWYRKQNLCYFDEAEFGERFWQPMYLCVRPVQPQQGGGETQLHAREFGACRSREIGD